MNLCDHTLKDFYCQLSYTLILPMLAEPMLRDKIWAWCFFLTCLFPKTVLHLLWILSCRQPKQMMIIVMSQLHLWLSQVSPLILMRDSDDISDLSPILDEESPTSTGSTISSLILCEVLGRRFVVEQSNRQCRRGWGCNALDLQPIIFSWSLTVQDIYNSPATIAFDFTDNDSPLIIRLNIQKFSRRSFLKSLPTVEFQRPNDGFLRFLPIYRQERASRS